MDSNYLNRNLNILNYLGEGGKKRNEKKKKENNMWKSGLLQYVP